MSVREDWKEHPQDFIVILVKAKRESGDEVTGYHIVDIKRSISHIIEDDNVVTALAKEMIEAGVKVVSMQEASKLIHPPGSPWHGVDPGAGPFKVDIVNTDSDAESD